MPESDRLVWDDADPRARVGFVAGVATAALIIAVSLAALIGPDVPRLSDTTSGDPELIESVETLLADRALGHDAVAVAVIDGDGVRFAGFGEEVDGGAVAESTAFEIGSVTKPLTGMLLADLIDDGEVDPDSTLGEVAAPLLTIDGGGADATLEQLASHRSGYPRLPWSNIPRAVLSSFTGGDPYSGSAQDVLNASANTDSEPSEFSYSNLGMAALGDGLAAHQRTTYADLLRRRLLDPIGMDATVAAESTGTLPANRVSGGTAAGRDTDEWLAPGWQPAGIGTWSTTGDLARLAVAIIDGTAPGMAALEPRFSSGDDQRIGYGWMIATTDDGVELTTHNGGTGGFRSWFGVDRSSRRAVVVLSDTTMSVGDLGEALLVDGVDAAVGSNPLPAESAGLQGWGLAALLIAGTLGPLVAVVRAAVKRRGDRHGLVRNVVNAVATMFLFTVLMPWHLLPGLIWIVAVALVLVTAAMAVPSWSRVPSIDSERPTLRWVGTGATVAVGVAAIALVSI
ncbi:MAG: serine hydrolase domain-containing protein [Ilumatobacter sp.]|uniref:serine hydrolase domain-containing protein n=1 Tax=Ilumatobacter sp. TaxID=1967498 RepID=UPI003C72E73D